MYLYIPYYYIVGFIKNIYLSLGNKKHNFNKYTAEGYNGYDIGTFDFNSIMLYSSYTGFEVNDNIPSMTDKAGNVFWGQRAELSDGDLEGIRFLYGYPYYKFYYVVDYDNYDNYGDYTSWSYRYQHYVNLYADPECRTLITTPTTPRQVNIYKYGTNIGTTRTSLIVTQSGTGTYIGTTSGYGHEEFGNTIVNVREDISPDAPGR